MDMALTLVSIASFFAMVLAWIVVPSSSATTATETAAPRVASAPATN